MTDDHRAQVEKASRGDAPAIDDLLRRHLPALRAFLRLRAGPAIRARESAADLAQSVCRELLQQMGNFDYRGEAAFKAWLFTAAMRKLVERQRYYEADKRDVGREVHAPGTGDAGLLEVYGNVITPSRYAEAHEAMESLERAFDALPQEYRDVIVWHRIVGLSQREIGERMGRSEIAVQRLFARARAKLSAYLPDPGGPT
ncbi:MAG: sigma-70 family RNA polymerase sigma factor [Planctomycetota bacterium]